MDVSYVIYICIYIKIGGKFEDFHYNFAKLKIYHPVHVSLTHVSPTYIYVYIYP
jgi:hypothetical protein